jgi:hypothetical protein
MTAGNVIDRVRALLKDDYNGYYRWSDDYMFDCIDEGQRRLSEKRPASLFTSTAPTTLDITEITATGDTLQVDDMYKQAMVNYVCYRCLSIDSEDSASMELAGQYLGAFEEAIG